MRPICLHILFILFFPSVAAASEDTLRLMFWNLENYFDWKVDTVLASPSEVEFTSFGKRHWTKKKFLRKSRAISKAVFWISDKLGGMPDAIGVCEVENRKVLDLLLKETLLRRYGYSVAHFDSPDPRGIDVALLYRKDRLKLSCAKPIRVRSRDGPPLFTRDILLTSFFRGDGDSVAFLVNHHPSKYGSSSDWRRDAAMATLSEITDSLLDRGYRNIVAMGDFNDTPESTKEYSKKMVNLAAPLAAKGAGTIKYAGKWEMIDMFFISPRLASKNEGTAMAVQRIPFLMVRDNTHSGEKPLRTYTGPRYTGGVSDHCPITLVIK